MSKLPIAAFAALAVATVGAFFVTQHLKVTTPLIAGSPAPRPAVINPISGRTCGPPVNRVDHRQTYVTFYLLHRADDVAVYIVDPTGRIIRTFPKHHMGIRQRNPPAWFLWDGHEDNGSIAPDGTYLYRIALLGQGRAIQLIAKPITIRTHGPQPVVSSVAPSLISPPGAPVIIHYAGTENQGGIIRIYRTDIPGHPVLVKSFMIRRRGNTAVWDGLIRLRPAAAGTYLVGLDTTDDACNIGRFPQTLPPSPGSTTHAGVTVRYLAAQPPLTPVPAGTTATVFIDSRRRPYRWALRAVGAKPIVAHGRDTAVALPIHLPRTGARLYQLAIRAGGNRTVVPVIAGAKPTERRDRVLVVLPALSWQGTNPVDDDGDGVPNTLTDGGPIALARPLADGLPAGFADEAALLAYLDRSHMHYDLTTDLALLAHPAAALHGYHGVVLAGSEMWLPAGVTDALRTYAQGGGHVLSVGIDSLQRGVTIQGRQALDPTAPAGVDAFGAHPGTTVTGNRELVTVISDGLRIFSGTSGAFPGIRVFEPIKPPGSESVSVAGTSSATPSIIGFNLGRGAVVDVALPNFGTSLRGNVDFQELLNRIWSLLSR